MVFSELKLKVRSFLRNILLFSMTSNKTKRKFGLDSQKLCSCFTNMARHRKGPKPVFFFQIFNHNVLQVFQLPFRSEFTARSWSGIMLFESSVLILRTDLSVLVATAQCRCQKGRNIGYSGHKHQKGKTLAITGEPWIYSRLHGASCECSR